MDNKLIKQCYDKSVELLIANSNRWGIMASTNTEKALDRQYDYIFGRDASICSLGMVASRNKKLQKIARASLSTLAKHQTKLGEIPYSVAPAKRMNLFYHLGSIDSNLWWLIAMDFYDKNTDDQSLKIELSSNIKKAIRWLMHQDRNNDGLLEQGEATDWADDMPVNGQVLYTNALWYKVLELYGYKKEALLARDGMNTLFLPHKVNPRRSIYVGKNIHRLEVLEIVKNFVSDTPYYLHYISYRQASERLDVYGNLLAIIFDVASPVRAEAILRSIRNLGAAKKYPVQVLTPPITDKDYEWREHMEREESLNKPFGYHNGGVWPYVGGFWVIALKYCGRKELAEKELIRLAEANRLNDWQFNEWLDGKKYVPKGMIGQSWNAGMFILAYHYLQGGIIL